MPIRSRSARGKEGDGTVTRTTMVGPRGVVGREAVSLRTFDNKYNDGRRGSPHPIQIKIGIRGRPIASRQYDGGTTRPRRGRSAAVDHHHSIHTGEMGKVWPRRQSWCKTCSKGPRPEGCRNFSRACRPKKNNSRCSRCAPTVGQKKSCD